MASAVKVTITNHRAELDRALQHAIGRKLTAMGMEFRSVMLLEVLVGLRGGRQYTIPGTGRKYYASKPGEAPAARTGDLRRSYAVASPDMTPEGGTIKVGSALDYALYLETGTSRVAARPHLQPTLPLAQSAINGIMSGDWGI